MVSETTVYNTRTVYDKASGGGGGGGELPDGIFTCYGLSAPDSFSYIKIYDRPIPNGNNNQISCEFTIKTSFSGNKAFIGGYQENTNSCFSMSTNSQYPQQIGGSNQNNQSYMTQSPSNDGRAPMFSKLTYKKDKAILETMGVKWTYNAVPYASQTLKTIWINTAEIIIRRVQVKNDNDELLVDLIPVYDTNTSQKGFFDLVSQTFTGNNQFLFG